MKSAFFLSVLGCLVAAFPLFAETVLVNLMPSGTIDLTADTLTLPLQQGALADGRTVWFVLTDVSDAQKAQDLGLVYAPDLANTTTAKSTRTATTDSSGKFTFASGTVDFSPVRQLVAGAAPNYFPPTTAIPGSVGDANYSPYVQVTNQANIVYNAPILAFDVDADQISFCNGNVDHTIVHDKVTKICPTTGKVTLALSHGFADAQSVVYVSFDANVQLAATMEASTYVPAFNDLANTGSSLNIYALENGQIGATNPERQGFDSALHGDGSPLNILDGLPSTDDGYSPLWALYLGAWTDSAIQNQTVTLLTSASSVLADVQSGLITGPAGTTFGSTGILINCPVVGILAQ